MTKDASANDSTQCDELPRLVTECESSSREAYKNLPAVKRFSGNLLVIVSIIQKRSGTARTRDMNSDETYINFLLDCGPAMLCWITNINQTSLNVHRREDVRTKWHQLQVCRRWLYIYIEVLLLTSGGLDSC